MTFPVRELAKYGILTDPDPYDLPTQAWSLGVNVRFRNKNVSRAPVFRNVHNLSSVAPRFVVGSSPTSGLDRVLVCYKSGRVFRYASTIETDYSVTGYVDADSEGQWSSVHLADVLYVNREDRVPWYLGAADLSFQALTAWDATWRTKLLRVCGGALVALNVTKGAFSYPTMVKTSSIPTAGAVPVSWDQTDPATLATENILAEMQSQIIDAQTFGNALCIYGLQETWLMRPVGAGDIFDYEKLPFQKGAINANCSFEIDGKNFVFGPDDIWAHDGVSAISICDERTRGFIYDSINLSKANRCFVTYNAQLKELSFNYVSGDELVVFRDGEGCNRAAVYSLVNNTWSFDDMPLVFSGARVNLDSSLTYATVMSTYETIGGSYLSLEDSLKKALVYVGETEGAYSLTGSLYAFDLYGKGSLVSAQVDENATQGMYLERLGIDLDEVGADLRGQKLCNSIYPQARLGDGAAPLEFTVGAADYFNQAPTYAPVQTYDGDALYKLDFGISGRWLSMKINFPDFKEVTLTGFDFDLQQISDE
jgi:hypothetical protein